MIRVKCSKVKRLTLETEENINAILKTKQRKYVIPKKVGSKNLRRKRSRNQNPWSIENKIWGRKRECVHSLVRQLIWEFKNKINKIKTSCVFWNVQKWTVWKH